jgi:hypothetical protein
LARVSCFCVSFRHSFCSLSSLCLLVQFWPCWCVAILDRIFLPLSWWLSLAVLRTLWCDDVLPPFCDRVWGSERRLWTHHIQ